MKKMETNDVFFGEAAGNKVPKINIKIVSLLSYAVMRRHNSG